MEEKILIKSEPYSIHNYTWKIALLCGCISFIGVMMVGYIERWNINTTADLFEFVGETMAFDWYDVDITFAGIFLYLGILLFITYIIIACIAQSSSLVVTDSRVYGTTVFGKRVDLPLDSVSAVGTSWYKGIAVGTSSGRIVFKLVGNNEDIHAVISKLLMDRQNSNNNSTSSVDELKKFKSLLDEGVITQEEFDAKKKQILGL